MAEVLKRYPIQAVFYGGNHVLVMVLPGGSGMKRCLLSLFFIPLLSGCMSNGFISNGHGIETAQQRIAAVKQEPPALPVRIDRGYVDTTPVTAPPEASWLQQPIEVHARNMTLANMLAHLLQRQQVVVHFQSGLNAAQQVHLDYQGDLRGACGPFGRAVQSCLYHYVS